MSKHTLSRIPKNVQHIFKVYETASHLYRPYEDRFVSQFVDKTGSYYEQFNRNKLRGHADVNGVYTPIFNKSDFPPVVRDIVARIFDTPLQLEEKLDLPDVPFDDLDDEPLFSDRHTTAKHFSDYQAKIVSSLASYYSPLTSAESPSAQKSLKWYRKLLQNTPVIFFLSQKQRLMTESGMRGINQPLVEFRRKLDKIKRRYVTDPDINKRIRNYHLTDLVTTDLFKLSVEREGLEALGGAQGPGGPETTSPKPTPTSSSVNVGDTLCTYLHNLRAPRITGKEGNTCSARALTRLETKYRLRRITRAVNELDDPRKVIDVFPYDIHYNDLYMLTIERPIFQENHKDVLDLLRLQEHFHVFAARISRAEASSVDLGSELGSDLNSDLGSDINSGLDSNSKPSNPQTYDHLLEWAESHRPDVPVNHVSQLLEQIGEWGLVEVEENASKSAFYVFGEPQEKIREAKD